MLKMSYLCRDMFKMSNLRRHFKHEAFNHSSISHICQHYETHLSLGPIGVNIKCSLHEQSDNMYCCCGHQSYFERFENIY